MPRTVKRSDEYDVNKASRKIKTFSDYRAEQDISSGNLGRDIESLNQLLSVDGWQDYKTLENNNAKLNEIVNRLNSAKSYYDRFGSDEKYASSLGDALKTYSSVLNDYGKVRDYYGQFQSADAYNYEVAKNKDGAEGVKARQEWYADIQNRLASEQDKAKREELSMLSKQYTRGQKVTDDYFGITQRPDFDGSVRDYSNPTKDDFLNYDKVYKTYQAYPDRFRDEQTNLISAPKLPEIEDKLGLFYEAYKNGESKWVFASPPEENAYFAASLENRAGRPGLKAWGTAVKEGDLKNWKYLFQEGNEVYLEIYYDLLRREGKDAAYKFLDDMEVELGRMNYEAKQKEIDGSSALEKVFYNIASVPMSVFGGLLALPEDIANLAGGQEINPYSADHSIKNYANIIRETTANDINDATNNAAFLNMTFGDVYSSLMSAADSLLGSTMGGGVYGFLMGTGAAEEEAKRLYEQGASLNQIAFGSLLAGTAEEVFEQLSIEIFLKNFIDAPAESWKQLIAKTLVQAGVEGSEEVFTDIANTITNGIVMGSQSDWSQSIAKYKAMGYSDGESISKALFYDIAPDLWKSFAGGAISGGAMGGVGAAVNYAKYGEYLKQRGSDVKATGNVENLKNLANLTATETGDKSLAKMASQVTSESKDKQIGILQERVGQKTNSSIVQKFIDNEITKAEVNRLIEGKFDFNDNGSTINKLTGEEVKIAESNSVVSNENGNLKVKLENGETAYAKNLSFGSKEEEVLYATIADLGVDADTANALIDSVKATPDSMITAAIGIRDAYFYGAKGVPASELAYGAYTSKLNETQRKTAYNLGRIKSIESASNKTAPKSVKRAEANSGEYRVTAKGIEGKTFSNLNEQQKTGVELAKILASLGADVFIYESTEEQQKARIANGYFVRSDGSIHVDINSGVNGEGLVAYTITHEFTHFIEDWSPKAFKTYADALFEALGQDNKQVSALLQSEIERLRGIKENASKTDAQIRNEAFSEVVAKASEKMFTDTDALDRLASTIKAKDKTLWQKICDFFRSLAEKIRNAYAGIDAKTSEIADIAKDTLKRVETIRDAFVNASVEALENFRNASVTDTIDEMTDGAVNENGKKLFQYRAMEHDIPEYRRLLSKYGMNTAEINKLFGIVDKVIDKVKDNLEILDYDWDKDIDDRSFNPVKPNSDSLYQYSVDFSTLCRKRILQQIVQVQLQGALDRAVTREESIAIRNELIKIQQEGREIEVACALCYVESARMKSPAQIQKFLDNRRSVITEYFASKDTTNTKQARELAEANVRARLYKENADKIKSGEYPNPYSYTTTANGKKKYVSLKQLPKFMQDEIRATKKAIAKQYTPTAEESRLLDVADKLSTSDFTSPEGLAKLIKDYPRLFDAYTSYVRNATKSKGLEKDTWWRSGDSEKISNDLIAAMNKENGLRTQSWSDFQVIHTLDYIAAIIELSTRGAKMQAYTKVPDYVKLMGNTNQMINLSLIPTAEFSGSLEYDGVEGMPFKTALELREKYPDVAGTICIGIANKQIQMLLASDLIDYVIPYHQSGMSKVLRKAMNIPTWESYEAFQNESELNGAEAERLADSYGVKLLDKNDPLWHKKPSFSDWFNAREAQKIADKFNSLPDSDLTEEESAMKKKYGVMFGGYIAMQEMADRYLEICAERGLSPKFSSAKADFTKEDNYWKLLIDRKMINNKTGEIIDQKAVKPVFNEEDVLQILDDEVARYPKVKADQEYATKTVVEKFLTGKMTNEINAINKITGAVQTAVDNVTKVSILNSVRNESDGKPIVDENGQIVSRWTVRLADLKATFSLFNKDKGVAKLADKVFDTFEAIQDYRRVSYYINPYELTIRSHEEYIKHEPTGSAGSFTPRSSFLGNAGVSYNLDALNRSDDQRKANIILHELIHACTIDAISAAKSVYERDTQAGKTADPIGSISEERFDYVNGGLALLQIYSSIASQDWKLADNNDYYGLTSPYEMVAELSNVKFREYLKKKSLLTRIFDAIKRIFGIKNNTAYESANAALYRILTDVYDRNVAVIEREGFDRSKLFSNREDSEYLELAKDPAKNEAKLRKMVEDTARKAGYNSPMLYHGTNRFGFTVTRTEGVEENVNWSPFFATNKKEVSGTYTLNNNVREISKEVTEDDAESVIDARTEEMRESIGDFTNLIAKYFSEWVLGYGGESYVESLVNEARPEAGYGDGVYDALDDIVSQAFYNYRDQYEEFEDFDEFVESDIGTEIYNKIVEIEGEYSAISKIMSADLNDLGGIYQLYANTDNLFVVDAKGSAWNNLRPEGLPKLERYGRSDVPYKTRDVAEWARDNGYSGVVFKNIYDNGAYGITSKSDVYCFFNPQSQVKSADPVTYDDNGNVIPLSERFNTENDDIRYSSREGETEYTSLATQRTEEVEKLLSKKGKKFNELANKRDNLEKFTLEEFNSYYWAHKLIRSKTKEDASVTLESIKKNGFESTVSGLSPHNILTANNDNSNAVIVGYRPRAGETVLLVPDFWANQKDFYVTNGFRPLPWEAVEVEYNSQPYYELYSKAYDDYFGVENGGTVVNKYRGMSYEDVRSLRREAIQKALKTDSQSDWDKVNELGRHLVRYFDRNGNAYSDREGISNRDLLANALAESAVTDDEKVKINQYKTKIGLMNAEEKRLADVKAKIKELSFAKGKRDMAQIAELRETASKMEKTINNYDRQLLNLEATESLKKVLAREKNNAKLKERERMAKTLDQYKKRTAAEIASIIQGNRDSRKRAIEGRNKTQVRNAIKKVVGELNGYLRDNKVLLPLQKPVAEALDLINMDTVGAEERLARYDAMIAKATDEDEIKELLESRERIKMADQNLKARLDKLKVAYADIINSKDPIIANSHDKTIENKIDEVRELVGETSIRDMTLEQLQEVHDMYKMILNSVRNANKIFKLNREATVEELGTKAMSEVAEVGGFHDKEIKALSKVKEFAWNTLKPIYAMRRIGSDTLTELYQNVRAGEDTWYVDVKEAKDFKNEVFKKYGYNSWDFDKQFEFTAKSGKTFKISLEQIMSFYAYSKRDQALKHLTMGGIVLDSAIESTEKIKGFFVPVKMKINTATAFNISEETLVDIIGTLTDEQKNFVDEMQKYLSEVMGAKGNEVSQVLYGVNINKEKYYFPLKSAKQFIRQQEEVSGEVKLKNAPHTKATKVNANNPIIMSNFMDVWAGHVNDMAMYHAFVLPLDDFYRVWSYGTLTNGDADTRSVRQTLQDAYGSGVNEYISQFLTDLNGGAKTTDSTGLGKLTSLAKKGAVFASASVTIQQPSAIARAMAYVNPKYFASTFVNQFNFSKHKADWEECKKYAPIAGIKEMGYFDTNVSRSTVEWINSEEYESFGEKLTAFFKDGSYRDEILSKAPSLADEITWRHIWNAVKAEIRATTNLEGEALLKRAGERFTEVITLTQVYDSVLSRSGLMRSKDGFAKTVTAFMAEPTVTENMIADAIIQRRRLGRGEGSKFLAKVVGSVAASIVLNSLLKAIVVGWRKQDLDNDEKYVDAYFNAFINDLLDNANPLTYIPIARDVVSIFQGYSVDRMDMSLFSDLKKAIDGIGSSKKSLYQKVADLLGAISAFFGIPLKNIERDLRPIIARIINITK